MAAQVDWDSWPCSWVIKKSKKYEWKTIVTVPGVERDYKAGVGWVETPFTMQMTLGQKPVEPFVVAEHGDNYPRFQSEIVYEILKDYYTERNKKMSKEERRQLKAEIEAEKKEAQESYERAQKAMEEETEEIVENSVVLRLSVNSDVTLDVEITKSLDINGLFESLCENYEIDEKKKKKLLTLLQTTQNGIV